MTKRTLTALALLAIAGCEDPKKPTNVPAGTAATDNQTFTVETLFTDADGYTVKRFSDCGQVRYYVTPGPAFVSSGRVERETRYYGKGNVQTREKFFPDSSQTFPPQESK